MVIRARDAGEQARYSPLHLPAVGGWKGLPKSGPASSQVGSDFLELVLIEIMRMSNLFDQTWGQS